MSATQAEIKHWLQTGPYKHRNWDQACQAFVYQLCNAFGTAKSTYLSANRAYRASKIVSMDPKKAGADAVHYWSIGTYGHVAKGIKGSLVLMASRHVTTMWATNVGTITVEEYTRITGARYLGWAHSNGVNSLTIVESHAKPVPKPAALKKTERRVGHAKVNGRQTASSTSRIVGGIDPGGVAGLKGFVRGEKIDNNNVWFVGTNGKYYWSGAFEDRSTHDLKDITPLTPKQRKIDTSGAYVWDSPFTGAKHIDDLKPNMVITIMSWAQGREHAGFDTWFQIGAKAWIWGGDCLDRGKHDVPQSSIKS